MSMNEERVIQTPDIKYTFEQMNILMGSQRLWTQFAFWMRDCWHCMLEESKDLPAVTTRLFEKLPLDFYNVFRIFYGVEVSQQFLNTFSKFITDTWQLINAIKNNNQTAIDSSTTQWYREANELASFLARINIYWNEDQWENLLSQYIRAYMQEVISYLSGNYEREIVIFDNIEDITARMAGYMSRGIIARSMSISRVMENQ